MSPSDFNNASNVEQTRNIFTKRLGEIIEETLGDDRIRKLFDQAGQHPPEHADKPTGIIALEAGVITPDTKTALLVAQAAERAYSLAEKSEALIKEAPDRIKNGQAVEKDTLLSHDDDVFKYVGSARDPQILQKAQGTWMAAQMSYNNEAHAINHRIIDPNNPVPGPLSQGREAAQGFKNAAGKLYGQAAEILEREGHQAAAGKLKAVSSALVAGGGPAQAPNQTMANLGASLGKAIRDEEIALNREVPRDQLQDVYEKLKTLTDLPDAGGAPPKNTLKNDL